MKQFLFLIFFILLSSNASAIIRIESSASHTQGSTVTNTGTATISVSDGATVISCFCSTSTGAITEPTGFTLLNKLEGTNVSGGCAYKNRVGAGTDNGKWTWTNARQEAFWIGSFVGVHPTSSVDKSATNNNDSTNVSSLSTGTTATLTQQNQYELAIMCNPGINNYSSYTNGFKQVAVAGTASRPNISVSGRTVIDIGTAETTVSWSGATKAFGQIVTLKDVNPSSVILTGGGSSTLVIGGGGSSTIKE